MTFGLVHAAAVATAFLMAGCKTDFLCSLLEFLSERVNILFTSSNVKVLNLLFHDLVPVKENGTLSI